MVALCTCQSNPATLATKDMNFLFTNFQMAERTNEVQPVTNLCQRDGVLLSVKYLPCQYIHGEESCLQQRWRHANSSPTRTIRHTDGSWKVWSSLFYFRGFLSTSWSLCHSWWGRASCVSYNVGWNSKWTDWYSFTEQPLILVAPSPTWGNENKWSNGPFCGWMSLDFDWVLSMMIEENIDIQKIYGSHYVCPSRTWPLGRQWLRDFESPVASFDIDQSPWNSTSNFWSIVCFTQPL